MSEQRPAPQAPMTTTAIVLLFIGLMVGMFMSSLNQTILSTALPTIVGELNGVEHMLWVSTAFMIASTIMMPIYGRLGDMFGRKPLFFFAIAMFLVGSIVGLCARDMNLLILGRVFQGIGGGGLMILSQAIIAAVVPARERGKYMGVMGATFAVSSVAGPLIGGWLTEGPGWRWAFVINLPLGLLSVLAAIFFLKVPRVVNEVRPKVDYAGMVLIASLTTSLILMTAWGGHQYAWTDPVILTLAGVVVVSAAVFVLVENRVSEPIVPMKLFRDRNFVVSTLAGVIIGIGMFGVLSYMPTYLQMVHGIEATAAGLMMAPMMAVMIVTSTSVGFLQSRNGKYKIYPVVGVIVLGLSLWLLGTLRADSPGWEAVVYLALMGIGLGMSMQTLVLVVQNSFPVEMVGTATASNNFFRQIGGTLGMSLIGSLFTSRLVDRIAEGMAQLGTATDQTSTNSLTPALVRDLPEPIHALIVSSYNDALTPIFQWVSPLLIIALIFALCVKEIPLASRIQTAKKPDTLTRTRVR